MQLIKTVKAQKSINANSFKIVVDKIVDMSIAPKGGESDMNDNSCQLTL